MKILFVHQNFPGQYKHQARAFAADPANEVIALTMAPPVTIPGVRVIQHAWNKAQTTPHAYMADLDVQVQRGQSTAHAATKLKKSGFYPDLILAHPGWGESLFLKDVYPEAKMICYQDLRPHLVLSHHVAYIDPPYSGFDQLGQHTDVRLSHIKTNPVLSTTLFQFKIPKNVDVVEQ